MDCGQQDNVTRVFRFAIPVNRQSAVVREQKLGQNWRSRIRRQDLRERLESLVRAQKRGHEWGGRFRQVDPRVRQREAVRRQKQGQCLELRSQGDIRRGQGRAEKSGGKKQY
ncbi:hypothetical protein ATANTOWER_004888 [Ataeniobius toweri]|uniref:Uncharacterized protein n=1 Tax=Ataeniobius toweri TaxID=208326 RepID=A0ABU7A5D0_9TELE|nr:hypothetical protein [Ataeniobius toweri]